MIEQNKRKTQFELLKVIAIVCVILCHCVPTERVVYSSATEDWWLFTVAILRYLGSIGNALFIATSTRFLVDNDKTKIEKVLNILANNQIISVIILILSLLFGKSIVVFSTKTIIKQIFPFIFSTLWYITCYVMYYLLHGYINKALRNSNHNSKPAIIIFVCFVILVNVFGGFYFTELMGFIVIHILSWYLKQYIEDKDDNSVLRLGKRMALIGISSWIIGLIFTNFVGVNVELVGSRLYYWNRFYNPFILMFVYGLLISADRSNFNSKTINFLSSCSLLIYIVTGNQLIRAYYDTYLYDLFCLKFGNTSIMCVFFIVCYAIIKIIVGLIIVVIYKKYIENNVDYIAKKEYDFIENKLKQFY